jgi:hypothetical protein
MLYRCYEYIRNDAATACFEIMFCCSPVWTDGILRKTCQGTAFCSRLESGVFRTRSRSLHQSAESVTHTRKYICMRTSCSRACAHGHTHTHTIMMLQTSGLKLKLYTGQAIVLRFQVGRMSFQAIKKAFYLKLITALRMFSAFSNKVTVCYSSWTLKLYCIVLSPDLGCTLPSRDSRMFRIGERVTQNELLVHVFETAA